MTPPRPLRQVLEELALHNRTHLRDSVTARLLTEALSSLDREEPARVGDTALEREARRVAEAGCAKPQPCKPDAPPDTFCHPCLIQALGRGLRDVRRQRDKALDAAVNQRVLGHGEGQAHTIADVNAGRVDDLIAPRLEQERARVATLEAALREYGQHKATCGRGRYNMIALDIGETDAGLCDCGFSALTVSSSSGKEQG